MEGAEDIKDDDFSGIVSMDEIDDNLGELWNDKDDNNDDNNGEGAGDGGDDDEGNQDDNDDVSGDEGDDGTGEEDEDDDNPDGDDEDDEDGDGDEDGDDGIELELVDDADEELVASVETLYAYDQLYLTEEQVKEVFNGTPESHTKLMELNKQAMNNSAIQQVIESMPERGKGFIEYLVSTNMKGDINGWLELESQVKSLEQYDLDNLTDDEAKSIIKDDYKQKGLLEKQIKFIIDAHEDNDELITEASALIKAKLKDREAAKEQKLKDDQAAAVKAKKAEVAKHSAVVKHIQATKFTTKKQEELYSWIYSKNEGSNNPVIVDVIANILDNSPEHLVQLAQLFDGYTVEKGFNLERLKKQVKSKEVKKTKKVIKRKSKSSLKGTQTRRRKNDNGQSLDDWLGDDEL